MKLKTFKKPVQLKLASMSENWEGNNVGMKSGKHRSQEMQAILSKARNRQMKNKKKGIKL